MNMTHPLPQCDCLNACGDDSGVAAGTVSPCMNYAANQSERIDNEAVAQFSCALRAKLREARVKGRSGWHEKALCSRLTLSDMLRAHVDKGDPRDVAAFAMFLWARDESIAPAAPAVQDAAREFPAMNPDLEKILGIMCFECIHFARALRMAGQQIAPKAEAEQAATLHWLLGHYFRSGKNWRAAATADMEQMKAAFDAQQAGGQ